MRRLLTLLGVLAIAASVLADVVYLRTGVVHEGKVTETDDQVIIETKDGRKITVQADQVVHIERGEVDTAEVLQPPSESTGLTTSGPETTGPVALLSPEDFTQPESMAFLYMRALAGSATASPERMKEMVRRWQNASHDRLRKIGRQWQTPEDIIRHRQRFEEANQNASRLLRKAATQRGTSPKDKAEQAYNRRQGLALLRAAAKSWGDPLLKRFLMGAAELEAAEYGAADALFRQCVATNDLVAAFHQGRGDALLGLDRPLDALACYTKALRLAPDSYYAIVLVQMAMAKVPGHQVQRAEFQEAKDLLEQIARQSHGRSYRSHSRYGYPRGPQGTTTKEWLVPGKEIRVSYGGLPELPYDRLVFRQGVAVPVGQDVLMVDAAVLTDAIEVYVLLDANTVVAVDPPSQRSSRRRDEEPPKLAGLRVPGYKFTPVVTVPKKGQPATAPLAAEATMWTMPIFCEMGTTPRQAVWKPVEARPGEPNFVGCLLPGEGAGFILHKGRLVGVLAGKTDVKLDGGGPDTFLSLPMLTDTLEGVWKSAPSSSSSHGSSRYSRGPAPAEPEAVSGEVFVICAIAGEYFAQSPR